jgi:hypothetical protein
MRHEQALYRESDRLTEQELLAGRQAVTEAPDGSRTQDPG